MKLYQNIYDVVKSYKLTNEEYLAKEILDDLEGVETYTEYWAKNEQRQNQCIRHLKYLCPDLSKYLSNACSSISHFYIDDSLINAIGELWEVDEVLTHNEEVDFSLTKNARKWRKKWRKTIKYIRKHIHKSIKGHIVYLKEWSKPKQIYTLNVSGEVHNGLHQTIKELIRHPSYIKYGFTKEI